MSAERLRAWLADFDLPNDGRLPPERSLAEMLGLSRAELRKDLARLEAQGLLWRQVGKGTFLRDVTKRHRPDATALAHRTSPPEAMQVRMILEPEIARLAARCATGVQIAKLQVLCREMRDVRTWSDYQVLDAEFHTVLARSAGNGLLAELYDLANEVRKTVVWGGLDKRSLGPPPKYHSFDEHEAIVAAVLCRDRNAAAEEMRRHLRTTEAELGLI